MRTERIARQKRLLKPHIYKTILAIGIFTMYTGMWTLAAGHKGLALANLVIAVTVMMIATNEEFNRNDMKKEEKQQQ